VFKIYLIPELNILTIEKVNEKGNEHSVDHILTNLFFDEDEGKQLAVKETKKIISGSDERLYIWLHNYAGLSVLNVGKANLE
jgi:hypothetical protein